MPAVPLPRRSPAKPPGAGGPNLGPAERVASLAGAPLLVFVARRLGPRPAVPLLAAGGYLVFRGATARCALKARLGVGDVAGAVAVRPVEATVTIERTPEETYRCWRRFEDLPSFMGHLESVTVQTGTRSHWDARAPAGARVGWDAELTDDRPGERIAWWATSDAHVRNAGEVRFRPAAGGRGTEVSVTLEYEPPAGRADALVAGLGGEAPDRQVRDGLRRFKAAVEADPMAENDELPPGAANRSGGEGGEHAGEPVGLGRVVYGAPEAPAARPTPPTGPSGTDVVEEASEDSFPGSDPPAYATGRTEEVTVQPGSQAET